MRAPIAAILSLVLTGTAALAETPLPAGKPAGLHPAEMQTPTLLIIGGIAIVAAGIAIAASGGSNNNTTATVPTTSTTSTG
jgi:hypothetical protein